MANNIKLKKILGTIFTVFVLILMFLLGPVEVSSGHITPGTLNVYGYGGGGGGSSQTVFFGPAPFEPVKVVATIPIVETTPAVTEQVVAEAPTTPLSTGFSGITGAAVAGPQTASTSSVNFFSKILSFFASAWHSIFG